MAISRNIRKSLATYFEVHGIRGVLAISTRRVFGFPDRIAVRAKGIKHPVWVRLRTSDAAVYKDALLEREYEYEPGFAPRTIVDAGANCGMTTIFYANKYPDARIIALEPEPSNFAALVRNVSRYANVTPLHAAIWNEDGQVDVFPFGPHKAKWAYKVRNGHGCRAVTLPTLMRETGSKTVDILKVDIEGAEREVFSQCDWMDRVGLLAIELHDRYRPGCSDAVNAVTQQFQKTERGAVTFYCR